MPGCTRNAPAELSPQKQLASEVVDVYRLRLDTILPCPLDLVQFQHCEEPIRYAECQYGWILVLICATHGNVIPNGYLVT